MCEYAGSVSTLKVLVEAPVLNTKKPTLPVEPNQSLRQELDTRLCLQSRPDVARRNQPWIPQTHKEYERLMTSNQTHLTFGRYKKFPMMNEYRVRNTRTPLPTSHTRNPRANTKNVARSNG